MKKLFIPPVLLLFSLILMMLFYFLLPEYNIIPFPYNLAGIPVAFWGFTIMGKSRDLFRKHQTTQKFERSSYLIREGIYAKTRNPMYLGMFLLLLGIGICFENLFSILTPVLFFLAAHLVFIPREEKMLSENFGEQFLDYRTKVRRWL